MAEISIIIVLLAGIGYGVYLFMKPTPKPAEPVVEQEEESEVMMAEEYSVIDETEDGSDPKDGVELSELEAALIDADADPEEEFKKDGNRVKELLELNYKIGGQEEAPKEEKSEDVVKDTEEDGLKYYPAEGPGRHDPFEYQHNNI